MTTTSPTTGDSIKKHHIDGIKFPAAMANVTDLQTKYSKLAQEYSKVKPLFYSPE